MKTGHLPLFFFVLFAVSQFAHAEIYRYQDETGKWRYTDQAPADQTKSEVIKIKSDEESLSAEEVTGEDIADFLTKKIQPQSDIERATIAVVKIETPYGTGSGFFITQSGYLITNKHVVRPSSSSQITDELKRAESNLKQNLDYLEDRRRELNRYKTEIDDYKRRMDASSEALRVKMQDEFNYHNDRYRIIKKEYQQAVKQVDASKQNIADYKSNMSQSSAVSTFKIIFKDGTEKKAKLIELGNKQDLALLKIIGKYKTPLLEEGQRLSVSQGGEVFAIGSPLGFRDFVTKGIVTRHEAEQIVTDTEILPGNSGGPLVTPQGRVIGVNTSVYRANGTLGSEVFGFAIPIELVHKEFSRYWPAN